MYLPNNTHVTMLFGTHMTSQDLGNIGVLKTRLRDADIFCPEFFNWTESSREFLQQIANGDEEALMKLRSSASRLDPNTSFKLARAGAIFDSQVSILAVDVDHDMAVAKFEALRSYSDKSNRLSRIKTVVQKDIQPHWDMIEAFEKEQGLREDHIARQLVTEVNKALDASPALRAKASSDGLEIVMLFGAAHLRLVGLLQSMHSSRPLVQIDYADLGTPLSAYNIELCTKLKSGYELTQEEKLRYIVYELGLRISKIGDTNAVVTRANDWAVTTPASYLPTLRKQLQLTYLDQEIARREKKQTLLTEEWVGFLFDNLLN